MPSLSSRSQRKQPPLQVEAWQPLDFQTVASATQPPFSAGGLRKSSHETEFVELVKIVTQKMPAPSESENNLSLSRASQNVQIWQPETLEAIENVRGNTHDHLRSREIVQQAQEKLRQAEREAQSILEQARAEAERIVAEAQERANLIERQAYADGQAAANAEAQGMLKVARAIVDEVQKWKENLFEEGEMMMLRLVIEIAQTIFGDGLPLDPDTLGQAFTRALSQAKSLGDLRIYLHPEDAAVLSAHWDKLQGVTAGQKVELIPSDLIKRGGCFIEGQYGTVDARVETQFQLATEALLANVEKDRQR